MEIISVPPHSGAASPNPANHTRGKSQINNNSLIFQYKIHTLNGFMAAGA
jgi:hypothetical protein